LRCKTKASVVKNYVVRQDAHQTLVTDRNIFIIYDIKL